MNAFGKMIQTKQKSKKPQLLAHLLQGVEALALRTCVEAAPDDVVLLQHDGFTAKRVLDISMLEEAMRIATGFNLTLDKKVLKPDLNEFKERISKSSFQK